jgi:hypothetical protein
MDLYLLKDHWARLVNEFKDSERETYGQEGRATELIAMDILDYARFTRFRQWVLFSQKRGEEFEKMMTRLEQQGHSLEAVRRFLEEEELWKTTLELAEQ